MKILKMEKGPPTIEEGQRRLDNLFEDFITRGADPEFTALLIFTYGVTETINYAKTVEEGISKIDEILNFRVWDGERNYLHPRVYPRKRPQIVLSGLSDKRPPF
jgi:hypothetical protein